MFQTPSPLAAGHALQNNPELPPHTPCCNRLRRLWPYFASARSGMILAAIATLVGALTEPLIPALLKSLADEGFAAVRCRCGWCPLPCWGCLACVVWPVFWPSTP